jgi:hypothetical protein
MSSLNSRAVPGVGRGALADNDYVESKGKVDSEGSEMTRAEARVRDILPFCRSFAADLS